MKRLSMLFLAVSLTGCGTTAAQWQNAMAEANRISAPTAHHRNVTMPQPMQNQDITWGAVPGSYSKKNNGTMRYMINTPQGIQYRTCQNLNGGTVYCN